MPDENTSKKIDVAQAKNDAALAAAKANEAAQEAGKADADLVQVVEKVEAAESVLVALTKDPTVDEMAAAIGLTLALDKMGKHATAIYSGKTPNVLEFLEPEKTFETNTNSLQDFIIALNKEKADHLRYKIEGDFVKVYITPYRSTINKEDLEFSHGEINVDLVIALNVDEAGDLDAALTKHGRIMHDASTINISNTKPGKLGGIEWNRASASSVSEMVTKMLEEMGQPFSEDVATALLTGIEAATERFSNEKTTPDTMAVAAKLMEAGADQQLIVTNIMKPEKEEKEKDIKKPEEPAPDSVEVKDDDEWKADDVGDIKGVESELSPEQQLEQMMNDTNKPAAGSATDALAAAVPEVPAAPEVAPAESVAADVAAPEMSSAPEVSPVPGVSPVPEVSPVPGVSPAPEVSPVPEVAPTPETATAPDVAPIPNMTSMPEVVPTSVAPEMPATSETINAMPAMSTAVPEVPAAPEVAPAESVAADVAAPKDYGAMMEEELAEPDVNSMVNQMVMQAQQPAGQDQQPAEQGQQPIVQDQQPVEAKTAEQQLADQVPQVESTKQDDIELPPPPAPMIDGTTPTDVSSVMPPDMPSLPPVQPVEPMQPTESMQPVESVQPVEPAALVQPVQDESAAEGIPAAPTGVEQVVQAEPINPVIVQPEVEQQQKEGDEDSLPQSQPVQDPTLVPPVQDPGAFKIPGM